MTGMTGGPFHPWLTLLRDLSLKSVLLLLAAWALVLALRRASAAARHLVWLLTFAGLLALPLLSLTLPPRPVAVLPAAPPGDRPLAPNSGGTGGKGAASRQGAINRAPTGVSSPAPPELGAGGRSPTAWPALLCFLWLGGVLLTSFPLGLGWIGAVRRVRRCPPVTDPVLLALAAEAGRRLDVRRPVALRSGPRVAVPVTFGGRRPVVLLPDGAASWPAERLRVALLHEMAHVRRGDWATQTTARLICALFWHNPLVWLGARRLRAEAERACDDRVLSLGIPAPDYAQHLLAVAGALAGADRPLPLAVPMAGQTALESRLRAVLTARPRRAPSRRLAACAFVLVLGVLVPLAALRPAARAARRTAPPSPIMAAVLPAPSRALRPAPVSPPVPIPSPPKGVPPMKPPTPVKTVALAALAAGLALPAAQAKPAAPVGHAPAPMPVPTWRTDAMLKHFAGYKVEVPAAPAAGVLHWDRVVLHHAALMSILPSMPWRSGVPNPVGVKDVIYILRDNAVLVDATPAGLAQVQKVIKRLDVAPEVASVAPRQVQLKFEWVSAAGAPNRASDKDLDTLTIIAEEGRKAQVSSRHLRNGTGGEETITVLARVKPGGIVDLDITEHSDTTARAGETLSNHSQTTVSVKDGETGAVGSLVLGSPANGQSNHRMLFVTPTIIRSGNESPVGTRSAPLRDGDIINVNPFTAAPNVNPFLTAPLTDGSVILIKPDAAKAP